MRQEIVTIMKGKEGEQLVRIADGSKEEMEALEGGMCGERGGVEEDLEYCCRCGGEVTGNIEGKRGGPGLGD